MTFDVESPARVVLDRCHGDLEVEGGDRPQIEVTGDRTLAGRVAVSGAELTISGYHGDLRLRVSGDATIVGQRISGDVQISDVARVELQSVGGDLEVTSVESVQADEIGGDVGVELKGGEVRIGRVGGDLQVEGAGSVRIGSVGGDAQLAGIQALHELGRVGGDLDLEWVGDLPGAVSGWIGGDAEIELGDAAHFTLRATVGGDITGHGSGAPRSGDEENDQHDAADSDAEDGWDIEAEGGELVAIFGEGGEDLHLVVGGDLTLEGGRMTNSAFNGGREDMPFGDFGIGDEMRRLARDLKAMGRGLARDFAREARESTRATVGGRPRVHVQFNDKALRLDAEQVERITREAREAAAGGIARAQEAVERALVNMAASARAWSPSPPVPGRPPRPPRPPRTPSAPGYTGQTVRIERDNPAPAETRSSEEVQEEKLAILRMVSEGRLSVEEAEVMLRALEGRG